MNGENAKDSPIGIFDSGVGGISVLKALEKELPHENFFFYGDQKNAPYGEKTEEEVRALSLSAYRFLKEHGVKATVIACNTATSAAAPFLREKYPEDIIVGMEPAVKPATLFAQEIAEREGECFPHSEEKKILVLATESTLKGNRLHHLIDRLKDKGEYILLPAPGIVRLLEEGKGFGEEMQSYLKDLLKPYPKGSVSSIVLGCTHFPFVKKEIEKALGYSIPFFDGAEGTARETAHRLAEKNLLRKTGESKLTLYSSSGDNRLLESFYRLPLSAPL